MQIDSLAQGVGRRGQRVLQQTEIAVSFIETLIFHHCATFGNHDPLAMGPVLLASAAKISLCLCLWGRGSETPSGKNMQG